MEMSATTAHAARRVKIFTVHGTFAHEADWDNWDAADSATKPQSERHFVNRLSDYLRQNGVAFEQADHSEFNWSGGNSHDERRIAAIALKKRIQAELRDIEVRTGKSYKDYYDGGVFVIGHSHGGTLSRLAINLWDKGDPFYVPKHNHADELAHDDKCPTCRRRRNEEVAANEIDRPDGVITFGSPFIRFRKRERPLLVAKLLARAMIFVGLVVVAIGTLVAVMRQYGNTDPTGATQATGLIDQFFGLLNREPMTTFAAILWPLFIYWLLALYLPARLFRSGSAETRKRGGRHFLASMLLALLKYGGGLLVALYLADLAAGGGIGLWQTIKGWLGEKTITAFWIAFPFVIYWLVALSLPRRALAFLSGKVEDLGNRLPAKYDPPEPDRRVPFLSYHTPGDEAGLHLQVFDVLTWVMRTVWLVLAVTMMAGIVLAVGMLIIQVTLGNQAMEFVWNGVLGLPIQASNSLLGTSFSLVASDKVGYIPLVLLVGMLVLVLFVLPIALLQVSLFSLVGLWLRGSGLVFGSERMSWTMAADIGATTRPSPQAKMRRVVIAPEAWWKGEMAHCYFYKADRVIKDLAEHIANWPSSVRPSPEWKLASTLPGALRWAVALLAVVVVFVVFTDAVNSVTVDGASSATEAGQGTGN